MQGYKNRASKKRRQVPDYVSQNQFVLNSFESPFNQKLNYTIRWVILAHLIHGEGSSFPAFQFCRF